MPSPHDPPGEETDVDPSTTACRIRLSYPEFHVPQTFITVTATTTDANDVSIAILCRVKAILT